MRLGDGQSAIVTDTVGFIHKLPHQLVDAFRATLDEVRRADVLLEVVDAADSHLREHRTTVQAVLDELGAGAKPRVVAYNKADLAGRPRDRRGPAVADRRRGRVRLGPHGLRPGSAARPPQRRPGLAVGGRRRGRALRRRGAAGAGARARDGRHRLPRPRCAGARSGHPLAGRRPAAGRGPVACRGSGPRRRSRPRLCPRRLARPYPPPARSGPGEPDPQPFASSDHSDGAGASRPPFLPSDATNDGRKGPTGPSSRRAPSLLPLRANLAPVEAPRILDARDPPPGARAGRCARCRRRRRRSSGRAPCRPSTRTGAGPCRSPGCGRPHR